MTLWDLYFWNLAISGVIALYDLHRQKPSHREAMLSAAETPVLSTILIMHLFVPVMLAGALVGLFAVILHMLRR
jgi:hypothetical protein